MKTLHPFKLETRVIDTLTGITTEIFNGATLSTDEFSCEAEEASIYATLYPAPRYRLEITAKALPRDWYAVIAEEEGR